MSLNQNNYSNGELDSEGIIDNSKNYQFTKNLISDRVGNKYKVKPLAIIESLSNSSSKAYAVEDLNSIELNNLYAAILDKTYPARFEVINYLKKNISTTLITPVEVGITNFSATNHQNIVIILPKLPLVTLRSYIKSNGSCSVNYIINNILLPINSLLEKLVSANITHGNINPDNIFVKSNGEIILGECVTEICGYSQKYYYEPLERAECENFAKGSGDSSTDYFALGMTCVYAYLGRDTIDIEDENSLISKRFEIGSFKAFIGNIILPSRISDLIKGLITDKAKDRWGNKQIIDWYNSKKYSIPATDNIEAKKPLAFNNKYYLNSRHIAYELYKEWEAAKGFLKEDHLVKWIEKGLNNAPLAEKIIYVTKTSRFSSGRSGIDSTITKTLAMLDPTGPMRVKGFAIYIDSIFNLIAFGFSKANNEYLSAAVKLINLNLWKGFIDVAKYEGKTSLSDLLTALDNCKKFIENMNLGYGLERCLYELDSSFPCQSLIVSKEFLVTNKELLECLEQKASDMQAMIMDRHIAGFIMSRINSNFKKIIDPLKAYEEFSQNKEINSLAMFAIAQKETGIKKLPNLAKNIAANFTSVIELINNKKISEKFHSKFSKIAETGSLWSMLKFILGANYIKKDQEGFKKALLNYKSLEQQKIMLEENKLYEVGHVYGIKLTLIISYLLCAITSIILLVNF